MSEGGWICWTEAEDPNMDSLTPKDVPTVGGINMDTGAQRGFFGHTNKENSVGAKWSNFLTLENKRIQRPEFGPK
jgi:hypothetical protein